MSPSAYLASGTVDAELLRARLRAELSVADMEVVWGIAQAALDCAAAGQSIDFRDLEREAERLDAGALWQRASQAAMRLWVATEELQRYMQPLIDIHEESGERATSTGPEGNDVWEDGGGSVSGVAQATAGAGHNATVMGRMAEHAWAMSFVFTGEVEGFRRRLPALQKTQDGWEVVGALQEHVGHIHSGVNAVLTGLLSSLAAPVQAGGQGGESLELLAAQELRSRVFDLRDSILSAERAMQGTPPAEWLPLLRQVYRDVEQFMFSPGFAWMRAPDKRAFIQQRQSLGEVLELWSPLRSVPARQTIGGLARYLEAMQVLNQRECLVTNDRRALEAVLRHMQGATRCAGQERREHIGAALAALHEARGRDAQLDALLGQTLEPGNPVPVEAILARTQDVLEQWAGFSKGG